MIQVKAVMESETKKKKTCKNIRHVIWSNAVVGIVKKKKKRKERGVRSSAMARNSGFTDWTLNHRPQMARSSSEPFGSRMGI